MKYTKMFFAIFLCFSLSCSTDLDPIPYGLAGEGSGGGTQATLNSQAALNLQVMSMASYQTAMNTTISGLRANRASNLITPTGGLQYAQLRNYTGLPGFNYMSEIRGLQPVPIAVFPYDQVRAGIVADLNVMGNGTTFKSTILGTFDWFRNSLRTSTYEQFLTYMEGRLSTAACSSPFGCKLSEMEKFTLTQMYNNVLTITKWIHDNPSPITDDCTPNTLDEWKQVAESAYFMGMGIGASLGALGVRMGAMAGAGTGGSVVAGVVGGLIGFTVGFVSGAAWGAGLKVTWLCLSNKIFSPIITYRCGNKTYMSHAASPPIGCSLGGIVTSLQAGQTALFPTLTLRFDDINRTGLVPNKGSLVLSTGVRNELSWFFTLPI